MKINCANDHDWGNNHDVSCDLDSSKIHDESIIDYDIFNSTKSGSGRASTLGNNDPTILGNDQSYEIFDKSRFGEVMTLVNVNPTIFEDYK